MMLSFPVGCNKILHVIYTGETYIMEKIHAKKTLCGVWNKVSVFMKRQYTPNRLKAFIALFVYPVITFYLFDLYTHNPFVTMNFKTQVLNIVFYQLMGLFLFGIFRWLRVALMLQSGLFMIIGLANYYVLSFRSAPIMPWDIYSLGTAFSVADNFSYELEKETIVIIIGFCVLLFLESRCRVRLGTGRKKLRLGMVLISSLLIWNYTDMVQDENFIGEFGLYDKLFTPTVMNKRDGNIVAFLMELEYLNVDKPEGYRAEEIADILDGGADGTTETEVPVSAQAYRRPNIIVIMNEAFSDLSVLGEFETNIDYMPFFRSLQEGADNTVTGRLNVSVLGGNTANTEFEFLTGNTMAFLPQGSVAYQQYVNGEVPSLASWLKSYGYKTVAMHPYYADGWERDEVYPLLGFQEFYSIEDFKGEEKVRNYYSDSACYDKITEIFEEKGDAPLFLFNVTMQNHSGYTEKFSNFFPDVKVKGAQSEALNAYLSLIKLSDNSLANLIYYFQNVEEDTVIVFFGDHQPTAYVSNPVLQLNGKDGNNLTEEEERQRYQVPFLIWANFDIEEQTGVETSANYLGGMVLEKSGMKLPPYQQQLQLLRQDYPVISSIQVKDKEGNSSIAEDIGDAFQLYRQMQYYLLFER